MVLFFIRKIFVSQIVWLLKFILWFFKSLFSRNTLTTCGEIYGIPKSTAFTIVKKFCSTIWIHLLPLVITKFIATRITQISSEFERLHGIPYIIGAVDGSHISIIASMVDLKLYYCEMEFYPAFTLSIVVVNCMFWNFNYE